MMPTRIFKGFVVGFDNGGSAGAGIGPVVTTFAIGDPPVNFWSPLSFGGTPIASGYYVAVAGKPSLVPGITQVALAYRRLGTSGAAHFFNPGLPGCVHSIRSHWRLWRLVSQATQCRHQITDGRTSRSRLIRHLAALVDAYGMPHAEQVGAALSYIPT